MASKKNRKNQVSNYGDRGRGGLCDEMHFGAAEAYKRLRTKISLMMPSDYEDDPCRIIGVTSSIRGEGKSTTAINLAYTLAEAGKKVCLIECDLRLPVHCTRLKVTASVGLSNLLSGQCKVSNAMKRFTAKNGTSFFMIPAGDIPPTPSELLGSGNMDRLIDGLSGNFDYIIVDLPPVTAVADALVVSKFVDGFLVAVRKDVCTKKALSETLEQLTMAEAKVLGLVFTDVDESSGKYYKGSHYYKKES